MTILDDIGMDTLRWANLITSVMATIITGRLFFNYYSRKHLYTGDKKQTLLVILFTFLFFFLFSVINTIVYSNSMIFGGGLFRSDDLSRFRTLLANVGTILLAYTYQKADEHD